MAEHKLPTWTKLARAYEKIDHLIRLRTGFAPNTFYMLYDALHHPEGKIEGGEDVAWDMSDLNAALSWGYARYDAYHQGTTVYPNPVITALTISMGPEIMQTYQDIEASLFNATLITITEGDLDASEVLDNLLKLETIIDSEEEQ
jgi:hypothetical protein